MTRYKYNLERGDHQPKVIIGDCGIDGNGNNDFGGGSIDAALNIGCYRAIFWRRTAAILLNSESGRPTISSETLSIY